MKGFPCGLNGYMCLSQGEESELKTEHFDVLVVGAGLSGICTGYYLQKKCPKKTFCILEGRDDMGGTWDLFRYPGIRSDSDMFTLGYSFRPWKSDVGIADGESILSYLKDTAKAYGLDKKIRYGMWVRSASWSSEENRWTVEIQPRHSEETKKITCQFLCTCCGYYDYDEGYTPEFEGADSYKGELIHPQKWDDSIDYQDKDIVVIGSGATAVTLVPALAQKARHVTMLQRSPTYILSRPEIDPLAKRLYRFMPKRLATKIVRWKNIFLSMYFYRVSRKYPKEVRKHILEEIKKAVGPDFDVDTHFSPNYNPWDERVCAVPDNDLFETIKDGRVSVVTDHIQRFVENGLLLESGKTLEADMIITATGLKLVFLGKVQLTVDGKEIVPKDIMGYKGVMFQDIPNLAIAVGYTNASWTLKCELTSEYFCRLLNHMDKKGYKRCTPRLNDDTITEIPFISLTSGYIQRATGLFPRQGSKAPWKLYQNYLHDLFHLRFGKVVDESMEFE